MYIYICGIYKGVGICPHWTAPKDWGYNLQQILESDVQQIPKIGHVPNPDIVRIYLNSYLWVFRKSWFSTVWKIEITRHWGVCTISRRKDTGTSALPAVRAPPASPHFASSRLPNDERSRSGIPDAERWPWKVRDPKIRKQRNFSDFLHTFAVKISPYLHHFGVCPCDKPISLHSWMR